MCPNHPRCPHLGREPLPLQVPPPSLLLYTDILRTDWGAHLLDLTTAETWMEKELDLYIIVPEMMAVQLALDAFQHRLMGESMITMNSNATGRYCFSSPMQSGERYSLLGRAVLSFLHQDKYWEEENSS